MSWCRHDGFDLAWVRPGGRGASTRQPERHAWRGLLAAGLLAAAMPPAVAADIEVASVAELRNALLAVVPGDAIVLRAGTYALGGQLTQVARSGTAAQPITIRPRAGEVVTITQAPTQNILQISASHVVLQDLRFAGGSNGIRLQGGASFVTLQRNLVRDVPNIGITASDIGATYQGLVIRQNEIVNTGTDGSIGNGLYLGCNNSACQVLGALVEGNHVHDLAVAALSSGIVVKPGSRGNTLRDNVLHSLPATAIGIDVGDASGGAPNTVERNALWNLADTAIRVGPNATVRNNLMLLNGAFAGIQALPGAGPAQNLRLVNNTVILGGSGAALRVGTAIGDASLVIANNALYAPAGMALRSQATSATITSNIGIGGTLGVVAGFSATGNLAADFANASLSGAPPADLMLRPGSALLGQGSAAHLPADDFNAVVRIGAPDVGAYRSYPGPVAAWALGPGFKPLTAPFVDSDGDGLADADDPFPLVAGEQGDVPLPVPALVLLGALLFGAAARRPRAAAAAGSSRP